MHLYKEIYCFDVGKHKLTAPPNQPANQPTSFCLKFTRNFVLSFSFFPLQKVRHLDKTLFYQIIIIIIFLIASSPNFLFLFFLSTNK